MPTAPFAHMAATLIRVPREFALNNLADPAFVGGWALGAMDLEQVSEGLFRGRSLFDGTEAYVEFRPAPELGLIDYAVGTDKVRCPRLFIRVTSGTDIGYDDDTCVVTLHALRDASAHADAWIRTCTAHETEILLIKAQLETAFARDGS